MPVSTIERPVSALRQRMLEDMAMRGLRSDTQHEYIRFVRSFAAFLGRSPDTAQAEDIRRFQVHQRASGVQPPTINCSVSALRFFFTVTLDRPDLSRRLVLARYPRKLPAVLLRKLAGCSRQHRASNTRPYSAPPMALACACRKWPASRLMISTASAC
jgi:site-specific recombinase XerD